MQLDLAFGKTGLAVNLPDRFDFRAWWLREDHARWAAFLKELPTLKVE